MNNPERYIIMNNIQHYLETGFNGYFDDIAFDSEMSSYISKVTRKGVLAFTACKYGVGIYVDENLGFAPFGEIINLGIAFSSFLETNIEEVERIMSIPDCIEDYFRASILLLCAFLAYYEDSTTSKPWGKTA